MEFLGWVGSQQRRSSAWSTTSISSAAPTMPNAHAAGRDAGAIRDYPGCVLIARNRAGREYQARRMAAGRHAVQGRRNATRAVRRALPTELIGSAAESNLGRGFCFPRGRASTTHARAFASNQSRRPLVQSITDYAIYMLDRDGIVVSWNAGAEQLRVSLDRDHRPPFLALLFG